MKIPVQTGFRLVFITNAATFAIVSKTARTRSRDHGQPARNLYFEEKKTAIKKVRGRPNHASNVHIFFESVSVFFFLV